MQTHSALSLLLALSLLTAAPSACSDPSAPDSLDQIELPGARMFPEGIAASGRGDFYIGSLTDGGVLQLRRGEARVSALVPTGAVGERAIGSAVGMVVDEELALLWVCDGGNAAGIIGGERGAAIVGVRLDGGAVAVRHGFPGGTGLCNDVALDAAGNLYATDSFEPRILRLAAADRLVEDAAVDWGSDPRWQLDPGQFGLNGIIASADRLYVAHTQNRAIYAAQLAGDEPPEFAEMALDRTPDGLDGLELAADGSLLVVEGFAGALTHIAVTGAGSELAGELSIAADQLDGPTTFALYGDSAWVVEGQLEHLLDPNAGDPDLPFRVARVRLDASLVEK